MTDEKYNWKRKFKRYTNCKKMLKVSNVYRADTN